MIMYIAHVFEKEKTGMFLEGLLVLWEGVCSNQVHEAHQEGLQMQANTDTSSLCWVCFRVHRHVVEPSVFTYNSLRCALPDTNISM